jgi:hypothetical protein
MKTGETLTAVELKNLDDDELEQLEREQNDRAKKEMF